MYLRFLAVAPKVVTWNADRNHTAACHRRAVDQEQGKARHLEGRKCRALPPVLLNFVATGDLVALR